MKKQIKWFLVGISILLLWASAFGYFKFWTPPEAVYKSIKITDNGSLTGTLLAYFNRTGENFVSGYQTTIGMGDYIKYTTTGYYLQNTQSAQIEDDGAGFTISGKPGASVGITDNNGNGFRTSPSEISIAVQTGNSVFVDNRGTGYKVGLQYDPGIQSWENYIVDFQTGTLIPKYMLSRTLANLTNNYVPFYSGGLWYNSRIIQNGSNMTIWDYDNGASIDMQDNTGIYFSPDSLDTTFSIYPNWLAFLWDYSSMKLSISWIIITSVNSGIALNSLSGVYVNNKLTVSGNVVVGTVQDIWTGTKNSMSVWKDNLLNANYSLVVWQDNDIVWTGVYFSMLVWYAWVMSDTLYSVGLWYKPYINSKNNTFLFAWSTWPKNAYKDKTFIVYADGWMGIETNDPKTTLDVNGMIKIWKLTTACSSTIAWTMKYSWTNFYGCNGSSRVQLDN